jgi:uncharacterized repeat protein (TIGR01451 family)
VEVVSRIVQYFLNLRIGRPWALAVTILCSIVSSRSETGVRKLNIPTADLLFEPTSGRVIASVPGQSGNLIFIDPATLAVTDVIPIGLQPGKLAADANGTVYVGINAPIGVVQLINSKTKELTQTVYLTGQGTIEDIQLNPSDPAIMAVSRRANNLSSTFLYDHGISRPSRIDVGFNQFNSDGSVLLARTPQEAGFYKLKIGESGLSVLKRYDMPYAYAPFLLFGSSVFLASGQEFDLETLALKRSFPEINALPSVAIDRESKRIFFLSHDPAAWTLRCYDLDTGVLIRAGTIPPLPSSASSLVAINSDTVAFRDDTEVYFVNTADYFHAVDLKLTQITSTNVAAVDGEVVYTFQAQNIGSQDADDVVIRDRLVSGAIYLSASLSQGSVSTENGVVTARLGSLPSGSAATLTVSVKANAAGVEILNQAEVVATGVDTNPMDNQISGSIPVTILLNKPVNFVTLTSSDLVYSPDLKRLLVAVPANAPSHANSIVFLNPLAGTIDNSIPCNSPGKMAVSGNRLYVALTDQSVIQQYDLTTRQLLRNIVPEGAILDLAALPGDSFIVSTRNPGAGNDQTAIFDGEKKRINYAQVAGPVEADPQGKWFVVFGTAGLQCVIDSYALDATGARLVSRVDAPCDEGDIHLDGGLLSTDRGDIYTMSNGQLTFLSALRTPGLEPQTLPAPDLNAVFLFSHDGVLWTLKTMQTNGVSISEILDVPGLTASPTSLTRYGKSGFAFRTGGNQIFLIDAGFTDRVDVGVSQTTEIQNKDSEIDLIHHLTINNLGGQTAHGVVLKDFLKSGVIYLGASSSQGSIDAYNAVITFSLGDVPPFSSLSATVTNKTVGNGGEMNRLEISTTSFDTHLDNNAAEYTQPFRFNPAVAMNTLGVDVRSIVYDRQSKRLFFLSWKPGTALTLTSIDQETGESQALSDLTRAAPALGIDPGGRYVYYTTIDFTLLRYDLQTKELIQTADLGPVGGIVRQILVFPGGKTVAISRDEGVIIFYGAKNIRRIQRPSLDLAVSAGGETLFVYDPANCLLDSYAVQDGTISGPVARPPTICPSQRLEFGGGLLYGSNGSIVTTNDFDIQATLPQIGKQPIVMPAPERRVIYSFSHNDVIWTLRAYDIDSLEILYAFDVPGLRDVPTDFILFGEHGLAFRTGTSAIYILQTDKFVSADIELTQQISRKPLKNAEQITQQLSIRNNGPSPATNVIVTVTFDAGLEFVSLLGDDQDRFSLGANSISGTIPLLAPGEERTLTLNYHTRPPGLAILRASAKTDIPDLVSTNNAIETTLELPPLSPQTPITGLALAANDLAYDQSHNILFAVTSRNAGIYSGNLVAINPTNFSIVFSRTLPSAAGLIALSSDESKVFVTSSDAVVHPFITSDGTPLPEIRLLEFQTLNQLAPVPGDPDGFLVSTPVETALYSHGHRLAQTAPSGSISVTSSNVWIYDRPNRQLTSFVPSPDGLELTGRIDGIFASPSQIRTFNDVVCTSMGEIFDFQQNRLRARWDFPLNPFLADDPSTGTLFTLGGAGSGNWEFRAFQMETGSLKLFLPLSLGDSVPSAFISLGKGRAAFRTESRIYITDTRLLPRSDLKLSSALALHTNENNITFELSLIITNGGPDVSVKSILAGQMWGVSDGKIQLGDQEPSPSYLDGFMLSLGDLDPGSVTVKIMGTLQAPLPIYGKFIVTAAARDDSPGNNTASVLTNIPGFPTIVRQLPINPSGLAYDPTKDRLLASMNSAQGIFANTVLPIDPKTGFFSEPLAMPWDPGPLTVNGVSSNIWIGANGSGLVLQMENDRIADSYPYNKLANILQLESVPELADTLVAGSSQSVWTFQHGLTLPSIFTPGTVNILSKDDIYHTSPDNAVSRLSLQSGGLHLERTFPPFAISTPFAVLGQKIYGANGNVYDLNANVVGSFDAPDKAVKICIDRTSRRLYTLSNNNAFWTLRIYDADSLVKIGSLGLPLLNDTPVDFIPIGQNGVAFHNFAAQLFIIQVPPPNSVSLNLIPFWQSSAAVGKSFTYNLSVGNNGIWPAHHVILKHSPPASFKLLETTITKGTSRVDGGAITVSVDELDPGEWAILTLVARPQQAGSVQIEGQSTADEQDINPADNSISTPIRVSAEPAISIGDIQISEDAQTNSLPVVLSEPASNPITVRYATQDGTALSANDYFSSTGILSFAPGETLKNIPVAARADDLIEGDEFFLVALNDAVGAPIEKGTGMVVIHDSNIPLLTIYPEAATEGANLVFQAYLSHAIATEVKVQLHTVDDSAYAGSDYVAQEGTLVFAPGATQAAVTVPLLADKVVEPTEYFHIHLDNPSNAYVFQADVSGSILDAPSQESTFQITSLQPTPNGWLIQCQTPLNGQYQLEFTPQLDATQWIVVGDPMPNTGSSVLFQAQAASDTPSGFYRVVRAR